MNRQRARHTSVSSLPARYPYGRSTGQYGFGKFEIGEIARRQWTKQISPISDWMSGIRVTRCSCHRYKISAREMLAIFVYVVSRIRMYVCTRTHRTCRRTRAHTRKSANLFREIADKPGMRSGDLSVFRITAQQKREKGIPRSRGDRLPIPGEFIARTSEFPSIPFNSSIFRATRILDVLSVSHFYTCDLSSRMLRASNGAYT